MKQKQQYVGLNVSPEHSSVSVDDGEATIWRGNAAQCPKAFTQSLQSMRPTQPLHLRHGHITAIAKPAGAG
jgi:hypothetical protein